MREYPLFPKMSPFTILGLSLLFVPHVLSQFTDFETEAGFGETTRTVTANPPATPTTPFSYPTGYGATQSSFFDTSAGIISGWGAGSDPACYALCLASAAVPNGCEVTNRQCQCNSQVVLSTWVSCLQTTCSPTDFPRAESMLLFNCPNLPPSFVPSPALSPMSGMSTAVSPAPTPSPTPLPMPSPSNNGASAAADNSPSSAAPSPSADPNNLNPGVTIDNQNSAIHSSSTVAGLFVAFLLMLGLVGL